MALKVWFASEDAVAKVFVAKFVVWLPTKNIIWYRRSGATKLFGKNSTRDKRNSQQKNVLTDHLGETCRMLSL